VHDAPVDLEELQHMASTLGAAARQYSKRLQHLSDERADLIQILRQKMTVC
jgi:uncharacterized protein YukE